MSTVDQVRLAARNERTSSDAILEVSGLAHAFGGTQAVNGVSLRIPRGAFFGLIGPNGAGKSTLLDCVSGAIESYTGRVWFDGQEVSHWPLHRIAGLGLSRTFQTARLFGRMTVLSNLMAAPREHPGEHLLTACLGRWRKKELDYLGRAWGWLNRFGLGEAAQNYGTDLSGGQRRLTELSRTLMTGPSMLLLDEPFAGVSPTNRQRLADQLKSLCRDDGITILMVEHRLELVEQLCEEIIVMAEGRIIAQGSMADLRSDAAVIGAYLGETVRTDGA